jgi:hypothetical protein
MLAVGTEVRYRIAALFEAHWEEFVRTTHQTIRAVVFETVRRIRACRTPALGCHHYECTSSAAGPSFQARRQPSGGGWRRRRTTRNKAPLIAHRQPVEHEEALLWPAKTAVPRS